MYCRNCGKEIPSDSIFCPNCGTKQKEETIDESNSLALNSMVSQNSQKRTKEIYQEKNINDEKHENNNVIKKAETESKDDEILTMPLFKRFIGSLIDKILILIVFAVGFAIISPFGAAGKMGNFVGILGTSPNNYEYIDQIKIANYGYYDPNDGIDPYYRAQKHLIEEENPPHIGSTKELDINLTIAFIILNLIYYILSELLISASLGKRMFGGVILDGKKKRIGVGYIIVRALCGGALMLFSVFFFHFRLGLSYYIVFFLFFLLMDVPVLIYKQSLIDLCSGTIYVKRQ